MLQDLLTPRIPAGYFLRREEPLTLSDSEPEPDLAIVAGQRRDFLTTHPATAALVIEVVVSSPDADRALAEIYAEAGVEEYWVVLPQERLIEVYRHPEGARYREMRTYSGEDQIVSVSPRGLQLTIPEIYSALS